MRKTLLSYAVVLLMAGSVHAQFNRTYNVPGYSCDKPGIVPADPNQHRFYSYMVSNLNDGGDPYHVLLTRLDLDGNVDISVKVDRITTMTSAGSRFIPTRDGGVLLVCLDDNNQVVVLKFDADLNQIWGARMPEDIGYVGAANLGAIATANLFGDPDGEDYVVVAPAATPYSAYTADQAFMVFRIDDHGKILWKKKYAELNRPANYNNPIIQDQVTTITHNDPGSAGTPGDRFVVAGMRSETGYNPSCGWSAVLLPSSPGDLFTLRIDGLGNIQSKYNRFTPIASSGKSKLQLITDRNTGNYIGTYSQYNMGPNASDPAGMALLRLDYGFNVIGGNINGYFIPGSSENYVSAINQSGDGHYLISSWPAFSGYTAPYLFKIDRASLGVIFNQRYNISAPAYLDYDAGKIDGDDNNYLAATVYNNNISGKDLRLIKASPTGAACGAVSGEIYMKQIPVTQNVFEYEAFDEPAFEEIHFEQNEVSLIVSDCGSAYFRGGVAAALQGEVKVYPTLLTATDVLSCDVTGNYSGKISIAVTNVLGQRVFFKEYNAGAVSSVSVPASVLSAGLNVVTVYNNGTLLRTKKVVRRD